MHREIIRSYDSVDSNWTFMYVLVCLIPVAFVAVAILSMRRDKATKREKDDIEMAIMHQRTWFPWRKAASDSERSKDSQGRNPYVRPPPPAVTKPPILPANFGRPVRTSKRKGVDSRTGDRGATQIDTAGPSRSRGEHSPELEERSL
ncbi:uncharacterized protein F4807DRAFT_848 [Annulohypoxylon truncatum]|uniref:uncharacterized protein n=1 Tax=Annulohypoxylon truncatum TaxID=327061 RepID=UPI0020083193|nr:uncharacterized protein F4807DRAFT_848 [Annulohypoxylon truncatum]KAI1214519.1 hypothetical protein F4807DRAFT_848 [Annulohypoxylon truncatum]